MLVLLVCLPSWLRAATWTNTVKDIATVGPAGSPCGYLEFLPAAYNAGQAGPFPLIIFLHGYGEMGSGNAIDLAKVVANGPPAMIAGNASHTYNASLFDGQNCIVLSPQSNDGYWIDAKIDQFLTYAVAHYPKIDIRRIYLTGLSMGGQGAWDYPFATGRYKLAAIVPMCGMQGESSGGGLLGFSIPTWAFHGTADSGQTDWFNTVQRCNSLARFIHGDGTTYSSFTDGSLNRPAVTNTGYYTNAGGWQWRDGVNAPLAGENPTFTSFQGAGHGIWTTVYNTIAMWNWLFAQTRPTADLPVLGVSRKGAVAAGSVELASGTSVGSATALTYTLANDGMAALSITGAVSVNGQSNCSASVVTQPGSSIAIGAVANPGLTISVTPTTAAAAWSCVVSIPSNDPSRATYSWTVKGYAASGTFAASYYNAATIGGTVALANTTSAIDYDWGMGSPGAGVGADNFCVRWTGYATPTATGTYTFSTISDDGARLSVNGSLLIDKWVGQGRTEWTATANLTAGVPVQIQMDFLEIGGGANVQLMWACAGVPKHAVPASAGSGSNTAPTVATAAAATPSPVTGTTATFSALGADNGGEPALTYTWATTGTPPAVVAFSANGTNAAKSSLATFTKAGAYSFQVTITDAGGLAVTSAVSVTVNQTLSSIVVSPATASVVAARTQRFSVSAKDQFGAVLAAQPTFTWSTSGGGTISTSALFTAGSTVGGPFTVTAGSAGANGTVSVTVIAAPTGVFSAQYYNSVDLTGTPVTATTATIDFDWGWGGPTGVGVDNFSARWTGTATPTVSGMWTLSTVTDDGVRMYVDGVQLIDHWVDQGAIEWTATKNCTAGVPISITMEYYEHGGGAVAHAYWTGPGLSKQPIPASGSNPNTAPTISAISNQTITAGGTTGALAVTVGDAQTAAGSLAVSAASSNTTLAPVANVVFGGSGANRTVTVTPAASQTGAATITLTVSDGSLTASASFTVTVNPVAIAQRIVVDVAGPTAGNVNGLGTSGALVNAIDTTGAPTGVQFEVTQVFGGVNTYGVNSSALYTASAQMSAMYIDRNMSIPRGDVTISNLNHGATYDLILFASRAATDDRTTVFTINGVSKSVNAANNTNVTVQFTGLAPAADGRITVVTTAGEASQYGYLNVLEVVVHPPAGKG